VKTIIAGTRTALYRHVWDAIVTCPFQNKITQVVTGKATGADTHGEAWARADGLVPVVEFPADWDTHGKAAGPIRNQQMADYADALLLAWDGKSAGSADMMHKAWAKGLRVWVWEYRAEEGYETLGKNQKELLANFAGPYTEPVTITIKVKPYMAYTREMGSGWPVTIALTYDSDGTKDLAYWLAAPATLEGAIAKAQEVARHLVDGLGVSREIVKVVKAKGSS